MDTATRFPTFILRLTCGPDGSVNGTVERVSTGEKARVDCLDEINRVVARMIAADADEARHDHDT